MRLTKCVFVLIHLCSALEARITSDSGASSIEIDGISELEQAVSATEIKRSSGLEISPVIRRDQQPKFSNPAYVSQNKRASQDEGGSTNEAESRTSPQETRDLTPPKPVDQAFSAGISQDGRDRTYFIEVTFGKNTKLNMLIDTSTNFTWAFGNSCKSSICNEHNTFGKDSNSLEITDVNFTTKYDSGQLSGVVVEEDISFAGFSFRMPIGYANNVSSQFSTFQADGILGLSLSISQTPSIIDSILQSKKLKNNLFAVSLGQVPDGINTGVINFGSLDDTRYTGQVEYYDLYNPDQGMHDSSLFYDWRINLHKAGFDDYSEDVEYPALITTGTKIIAAPLDHWVVLMKHLPGYATLSHTKFCVPCNTTAELNLQFDEKVYTIPPSSWVGPPTNDSEICGPYLKDGGYCKTFLRGTDDEYMQWEIGDLFLKEYYTVFDIDNNRIGFANSNSVPSNSSSSNGIPTLNLDDPDNIGNDNGSGTVTSGSLSNLTISNKSNSGLTQDSNLMLALVSSSIFLTFLRYL